MAVTEQGIYYQDNYSSVADVPEDMEKMAESIDKGLEKDRDRLSKNEKDIQDIQVKNASQDEQIAELEDKVVDLNNNQIHGQASGEYVHLSDSANMNCSIGVCGNSRQETREGYNLFNTDKITENKYVDMSKGVLVDSSFTNTSDYIEIKANETYIFVYKYSTLLNGNDRSYCMFDTDKNYLSGNNYAVKDKKIIFNPTQDGYIRISFDKNFTDIMFYKGTDNKEYEPYGAMPSIDFPSEIESVSSANVKVCNKNILEFKKENWIGGYFNSDGTVNSYYDTNESLIDSKYYRCIENTKMTITLKTLKSLEILRSGIAFYNYKKEPIKSIVPIYEKKYDANTIVTFQIDIPDNACYFRINLRWLAKINSDGTVTKIDMYNEFYDYIGDFMIEIGATATDYIAHEEQNYPIPTQQPFRSIGDIRDTFIKKDGKRYERHNIARKIFDGTENLIYTANTGNRYAYSITLNGKIKGQHSKEYLSNMYKQKPEGSWTRDGIISVSATSYNTYIFITGLATTSDVKAWLKELYDAGTPLCIDYILETPLDIECTPEQNEILDKLEKAKTYKNITNIFSTDEVSAIIDVDYKKDLETILNSMQQAILSQGGNV